MDLKDEFLAFLRMSYGGEAPPVARSSLPPIEVQGIYPTFREDALNQGLAMLGGMQQPGMGMGLPMGGMGQPMGGLMGGMGMGAPAGLPMGGMGAPAPGMGMGASPLGGGAPMGQGLPPELLLGR